MKRKQPHLHTVMLQVHLTTSPFQRAICREEEAGGFSVGNTVVDTQDSQILQYVLGYQIPFININVLRILQH